MSGMTGEEWVLFHARICDEARKLSEAKNNDYASPDMYSLDPHRVFRNFRVCELLGICSTEQGFLVRLTDKISRLTNLLKPEHEQAVKDESIDDTLLDVVNYAILLMGYRKNKRELEVEK